MEYCTLQRDYRNCTWLKKNAKACKTCGYKVTIEPETELRFSVVQNCNLVINAETFMTFDEAKKYASKVYADIPVMPRIIVTDIDDAAIIDDGDANVFFDLTE
jgi:hypothetical protein